MQEVRRVGHLRVFEVLKRHETREGYMPPLRVLAFGIEVYDEGRSPEADRDLAVMVAVKTSEGVEEVFDEEKDGRK